MYSKKIQTSIMSTISTNSQAIIEYINNNAKNAGEFITDKLGTPEVTEGLIMAGTGTFVIATGSYSLAVGLTRIFYAAASIGISKASETLKPHIQAQIGSTISRIMTNVSTRTPFSGYEETFVLETIRHNPTTDQWYIVGEDGDFEDEPVSVDSEHSPKIIRSDGESFCIGGASESENDEFPSLLRVRA